MSDILFEDKEWKVRREEASLPDGRTARRTRVYRCDAVHILAFSDPQTVLLLREYRPFYDEWVWMLPSGRVDKEQDIVVAAQRELREETGFRAEELQHWFSANHSEHCVFTNHVFRATKLARDPLEQDHDEMIEVHEVSLQDAIENARNGLYDRHVVTAYALLRYDREVNPSQRNL